MSEIDDEPRDLFERRFHFQGTTHSRRYPELNGKFKFACIGRVVGIIHEAEKTYYMTSCFMNNGSPLLLYRAHPSDPFGWFMEGAADKDPMKPLQVGDCVWSK